MSFGGLMLAAGMAEAYNEDVARKKELAADILSAQTKYLMESGLLNIQIGTSQESLVSKIYKPNDSVALSPGVIHRMEAIEDCIYLEASTPEIDDVIRLSDDYDRGN